MTHPLGDLLLHDPRAVRALAHPVRLACLTRLQRHGPATATALSPHVGATPSVVSWHLRHLADHGLVRDADPVEGADRRQRRWAAVAPGWRVDAGDDPEALAAGRALEGALLAASLRDVEAWRRDVEPGLPPAWQRGAGVSDTGLRLTADELVALQEAVEGLLAPYLRRTDPPEGARPVRLLRVVMPGPG